MNSPVFDERAPGHTRDDAPLTEALRRIHAQITPIEGRESIRLQDALGRVLAEPVQAPIDVPAHDNAAMDGWALRSADLRGQGETHLRAVGSARAGVPFLGTVRAGEAVRVMTGTMMPTGTDTVVMQEAVTLNGDTLQIPVGTRPGQHRRVRGEDLKQGAVALPAGRLLRPADLGLLASLGVPTVPVRPRLRVAFFSSGDELRSIGDPLPPGCIYDSNRYTLHAMLTRLGLAVVDLGVVRDTPEALEATLLQASTAADVILSSGGVSVGDADYTRTVMARLGEVDFWRIAMRPGRPMAFGRIGRTPYFGLPGNPVAVMVTFLMLVREALLQRAGAQTEPILPVQVRCLDALGKRIGRTEFLRAVVRPGPDGQLEARTTHDQGSGVLRSMSEANALLRLPPETGPVAAGDWVEALLFEGLI